MERERGEAERDTERVGGTEREWAGAEREREDGAQRERERERERGEREPQREREGGGTKREREGCYKKLVTHVESHRGR